MVDCSCLRNMRYRNVKYHYFLFNAALACVIPFLPVHAKEIGISPVSVGVIYSLLPLITMILKPFFGCLADHFNNIKSQMLVFLGIIMLSSVLTVSIPRKQNMINSEVLCTASGTYLYFKAKPSQNCMIAVLSNKPLKCYMYCSECVSMKNYTTSRNSTVSKCHKSVMHPAEVIIHLEKLNNSSHTFLVKDMTLSDRVMNTLCFVNLTFTCSSFCEPVLQECFTGKEEPEYNSDQFWLFLIFAALSVSFAGVTTSFSDAICFNELGENGHLYGRQRLWGTVGWGLLSPIAGAVNDFISGDSFLKQYQPGAIIHVVIIIYDICICNSLKTKNLKFSQNIFTDVGKLFRQFKVVAFMLSVFVIGSYTALLWSFLFWHLMNLGANRLLLGIATAIQCFLGELPFFFFFGKILSKLGHFNILALNLIAFGLRFIAYSYIQNPWLVLPIELLQGPTYGLFYATMASFAHVAAPSGTEVTVQGLVGGMFELGMVAGNILGGIGMQRTNGSYLFFWAGVSSFGYCVVHVIMSIIVIFLKKREEPNQQEIVVPPEENVSFM